MQELSESPSYISKSFKFDYFVPYKLSLNKFMDQLVLVLLWLSLQLPMFQLRGLLFPKLAWYLHWPVLYFQPSQLEVSDYWTLNLNMFVKRLQIRKIRNSPFCGAFGR